MLEYIPGLNLSIAIIIIIIIRDNYFCFLCSLVALVCPNPVAMYAHCYNSSVRSTTLLHKSILASMTFKLDTHIETVHVQSAKYFDRQFKFER